MNERSDAIVLAERHVVEARIAALAEYRAVRASLRRCMGSPAFIVGALLGAIGLGYLAAGRGKPKCPVCRANPEDGSQVFKAVQVLLPLLLALASSTGRREVPPRGVSRS